ncbi:MAG TPA: PQQ-dependent sugar dehydrogenase [Vicinamibacterales bacterium]|nr:PQQ-dependent sugar dehydrogenase [Vicinamibacterales bacterium]
MTRVSVTFVGAAILVATTALIFAQRQPDPRPRMVPGQSIETRPPEKSDDKPAFPGQTRAPYKPGVAVDVTVITDKLNNPWSLAFLPGGRMLVSEKPGTMRIVDADGVLSEPLGGVPEVLATGQIGLLDLALDPAFGTNHRLFFMFSEPVENGQSFHIAVGRATLDEQARALQDVKVIFRARPDVPRRQSANSPGRIAIARDGTLFVAIGDSSTSPPWDRAQRLDTHLGKIIHITADGAPAPGNPFASKQGALPEIWSMGHRTPEGLAFDARGQLWETEHGPRGGDELNKIEAGKNYGWPVIVHGIDYPGMKIGEGITEKAGMEQPIYYWDPVIAPSGLAFYDGSLFPSWHGDALVGSLRGEHVSRLTLKNDRVVSEEPLLVDQHSRIRDVRVGPDGAVYVLTDSDGKLLVVRPKK